MSETRQSHSTNTLILSDIHLGSPVTRVKECQELINSYKDGTDHYRLKRVVLLGDIFDDMNFRKLRTWEWDFINQLRQMSELPAGVEVVWIIGNHDEELDDLMSNMMNTTAYTEYQWQVGNLKCFAIHGHQFDRWIQRHHTLTNIPYWIYNQIQKIDGAEHHVSRFLKELTKKMFHLSDVVADGALAYIKKNNISTDAVFCGHTHLPDQRYYEAEKIAYYNGGCWTGMHHPTYVAINDAGQVEIFEFRTAQERKGLFKIPQVRTKQVSV